jgi:hypothetical protein
LRVVLQAPSFVTALLVARLLMTSAYRVMALAGIWTTSVGRVAQTGLGGAIIEFRDLDRREIDTCFWITITLATIGYYRIPVYGAARHGLAQTLTRTVPVYVEWT